MQLKRKRDDDMDAITQKRHKELMAVGTTVVSLLETALDEQRGHAQVLQEQSEVLKELCALTSAQGSRVEQVEPEYAGESGEDKGSDEEERGSVYVSD